MFRTAVHGLQIVRGLSPHGLRRVVPGFAAGACLLALTALEARGQSVTVGPLPPAGGANPQIVCVNDAGRLSVDNNSTTACAGAQTNVTSLTFTGAGAGQTVLIQGTGITTGTGAGITVGGTTNLQGTILDSSGNLTIGDNVDLTGTLAVTGNETISGTLAVSGVTTTNGITNTGNIGTGSLSATTGTIATVNAATGNITTVNATDVTASGTVQGGTVTDGTASMTGGNITGVGTVTAGTGNITTVNATDVNATTVTAATGTVTTVNATTGNITTVTATDVTASGTVQGGTLTDGTASMAGGNITGVGTLTASTGNITTMNAATVNAGQANVSGLAVAAASTIDMGGNRIQNVGGPVAATDAATKAYVDSALGISDNRINAAFDRIDSNTEGIAIAIAMGGLTLPDSKTFAISANMGFYDGKEAFAAQSALRISEILTFNGGIGVGLGEGKIGGRVGFTAAW